MKRNDAKQNLEVFIKRGKQAPSIPVEFKEAIKYTKEEVFKNTDPN